MPGVDDESDSEDLALGSLFIEPPRSPPPEPTLSTYIRSRPENGEETQNHAAWSQIDIRLVGSHSLWGHYLWNAARAFAIYLDTHQDLYRGKNVLELGAGGGLPGLVTTLNGARKTVLTDYPDHELLDNLARNVDRNIPTSRCDKVAIEGHIWGSTVAPLLAAVPEKFDLIILSDLVFNHSQHDALLRTCELTLRNTDPSDGDGGANGVGSEPTVLVFYTHHRPHLAARDLDFFAKARSRDWECMEIVTERYPPMFPDDPGEEEVRATVHGWRLTRASHGQ